ncbi:site-specific DNA-methyltransferase [Microbacterium sp. No. 7]|uniref:DNA methyltransferase n=1 Tax=Microbacterium sp. No. 7 TaxID=1714373 RepID=UPI00300A500F
MAANSNSPQPHILVIGDSVDALPALRAEYAVRVDLVYIDPPFDHGDGGRRGSQRLFPYSDRRGADWAGFMQARLALVKPLLTKRAPVAVSIGHRRLHETAILLADAFEGYEVVTITVDRRRAPADRVGVQQTAEYILIAVPPRVRLGAPGLTSGAPRNGWGGLALSGYDATDYPNQVYPIVVESKSSRVVRIGESRAAEMTSSSEFAVRDGEVAIWPVTRDGKKAVWRIAKETAEDLLRAGLIRAQKPRMPGNVQSFTMQYVASGTRDRIEKGEVATFGLDARGALSIDRVQPVGAGVPAIWRGPDYETRAGSKRLEELIGEGHGFPYPKSPALIADIIRCCTGANERAVVLDFFAGSGSTLDAVCQLNTADGGTRQAVLVQLDESEIVERVLLPRVRAVVADADATLLVRELPA